MGGGAYGGGGGGGGASGSIRQLQQKQFTDRSNANISIQQQQLDDVAGADRAEVLCVTVFGFNTDSLGLVLSEFNKVRAWMGMGVLGEGGGVAVTLFDGVLMQCGGRGGGGAICTRTLPTPVACQHAVQPQANQTVANIAFISPSFSSSPTPPSPNHKCGTVVRKQTDPHGGNWVHLAYRSREDASKALQKHRFKLTGRQMLAVEECQEFSFVNGGSGASDGAGNASAVGAGNHNTTMNTTYGGGARRPRPLVPMNSPLNTTTPRKQGVLGTTMSYIFGV
jgi:hypothetical protein